MKESVNLMEDIIKQTEDIVNLPEDIDQQLNDNTTTPDDIIKFMKDIIKTEKLLMWQVKDNKEGVDDSINSLYDIISCPDDSIKEDLTTLKSCQIYALREEVSDSATKLRTLHTNYTPNVLFA